jgi:hypothetical protein
MQMMKKILIVVSGLLVLAGCDDPGEGPRYEAARREAEPVLMAIHAYRSQYNRYPSSLDDLTPTPFTKEFIDSRALGQSIAFSYTLEKDDSFFFEFVYTGPGRNRCRYVLNTSPAKWDCWGHY